MKSSRLAAAALSSVALPAARFGQKDDSSQDADLVAEIKALGQSVGKQLDQLKADNEKLKNETGEIPSKFESFKSEIDERLSKFNEMTERLKDLEQKSVRGGSSEPNFKSVGERFANDDKVKSFSEKMGSGGRVSMEFEGSIGRKDITSATTAAPGSAGALIQPDQRGLVAPVDRRLTVRSLLSVSRTSSNSIEYEREELFDNQAAPAAEGATRAQSELQFSDQTAKVISIGHFMRTSREILADAPRLASYIDGRMVYGVNYKEELQVLLGSGTGNNLEGLVTAAAAYAPPALTVANKSRIDVIRLAILQSITDEYAANGIVLNHIDWSGIELQKDSTGAYVFTDPQRGAAPTLWNLPVVATNAMTADNFLVGDFAMAAELFDRELVNVEASTEDGDNFRNRKVTILGEERVALAIYRPDALVTGDFTTALA